jgi:ATP-dependent protease HslVU (ClpYQ) peptidase subunit
MTAIAAFKHPSGQIWVGADRRVTSDNCVYTQATPKFWTYGARTIIGVAGDDAAASVLEAMTGQTIDGTELSPYLWVSRVFAVEMRQALKDADYTSEENTFDVLLVVGGEIFTVSAKGGVMMSAEPMAAVGSGAGYVLAALDVLFDDPNFVGYPALVLERALKSAARFDPGVAGPFDVMVAP